MLNHMLRMTHKEIKIKSKSHDKHVIFSYQKVT